MFWIIQNNIYSEEGHERLINALERLSIEYRLVKVVPFSGVIEPMIYPPDGPVIVMGSYTLAKIAQLRGWTPGSFINDNLDYRAQLEHWGNLMLNHDALICKIDEVPEQIFPFFIRPVFDSKDFTGQVMDWPQFDEWRNYLKSLEPEDNSILDINTLVMVCSKKEIWSETRTWVINGHVVTASGYKRGTIKLYSDIVEPRIIEFVNSLGWYPHKACVIDVADTPNGLKIVEVNNLNSSGFYKADMVKLVMSLEQAFS